MFPCTLGHHTGPFIMFNLPWGHPKGHFCHRGGTRGETDSPAHESTTAHTTRHNIIAQMSCSTWEHPPVARPLFSGGSSKCWIKMSAMFLSLEATVSDGSLAQVLRERVREEPWEGISYDPTNLTPFPPIHRLSRKTDKTPPPIHTHIHTHPHTRDPHTTHPQAHTHIHSPCC